MIRTLTALLAIRTSITANVFIYFVQKLPLIGKMLPDQLYARLKLKTAFAVLAMLFKMILGFLFQIVLIGVFIYLPVAASGESLSVEAREQLFMHLFVLLCFVVPGVSRALVLEPKREKYIAVKLMRLSPTRYMQASLSHHYVTSFIYQLPAVLIFASMLSVTAAQVVLLAAMLTLWRILCEYAHLLLFHKTGIVLIRNNVIVWLAIGLGCACAYVPLLLNWTPITGSLLLSTPAIFAAIAAGSYAVFRLARYAHYREAVDVASRRDDPLLNIGRMMLEAQMTSVASKESDFSPDSVYSGRQSAKEGYAYVNDLFFARHRSVVSRPLYKRMAIVGALGVAGTVVVLMFESAAEFLRANMMSRLPIMILAMSVLSVGEKISRALFYNCDISLLRYSFYRNAAYSHYRIRLFRLAGLNLLIAAMLGAALTSMMIASGGGVLGRNIFMMWTCTFVLAVFFSVHHLFMYYIFQPYSTELNVKNPLYYVVSMAVSSASGIGILVKAPVSIFTLIVVIATLVYLVVSLVLVRKYGYRTFRVR